MRLSTIGRVFFCVIEFLSTWWRHDMDTLCKILGLNLGNSPVTGGYMAQRVNNAELTLLLARIQFWKGRLADKIRRLGDDVT